MKRSELWVEASDIKISIAGELIKKVEAEEVGEDNEDDINELECVSKIEDKYSKGREILGDKLPERAKRV